MLRKPNRIIVNEVNVSVMTLIDSGLQSEEVREAAVKAAAAWLQFGVSLPACIRIAGSLIAVVQTKTNDIAE